ncbi:unnamed protein product [Trichobilharzia szidati]|nr:unnamed protein product [Trichobilharzia szidati]
MSLPSPFRSPSSVEQQSNDLRTQLSETNKLKQELELSLESVNRKLREKDDEINDLTCRLSSVQIIQPTTSLPAVVETQSPNVVNNETSDVAVITTTSASASSTTSDQSSIERIESLENQLKHRTEELDNSTTEIQRLTMQLYSLQETVKSLQASLSDRDSVLATATSERSALSRAMEQNKTLKQQVTDLQDAYAQMTTTNANLSVQLQQLESECKQSSNSMTNYQKQVDELNKQCDAYQLELKSANEMNYALSKQIEHLNILQQAESLNQAETINQSTNVLSVDKEIQTIHIEDDVEKQNNQGKSDSVQHEQYQRQQEHQEATNMNALLAKIETDQIHINQLTNEVTMLQNLFTRVTKLCYELQAENEQDKELSSQFSDPAYCINALEESVKRLMYKSSLSVNDTCVQCSISVEQKALEDLEILQVAHTQLEAKFIKCMEELSTVSEERSRLESVNAQLEMEATTVEEYVTLFTHRRAAAAKRARARELLLQRLVDDRKRLRLRLQQLYKQMKPVQNQETNGIHNEHLGDTNTTEEVDDTSIPLLMILNQ